MDKKRRTAISGLRRRRTGGREKSKMRPPSRKPQSKMSTSMKVVRPQSARPQTRKPKPKTSQKKQRPKTRKEHAERPKDPMTSPNLEIQDLEELRELEQLFWSNQSFLRSVLPTQEKLTPPPSRRSGISLPPSRSAIVPGSKSGVVIASRSGVGLQTTKSGATMSSRSCRGRSKSGLDLNKPPRSVEDANAEMISNSVRYMTREWIGMKIMNDFIPSRKLRTQ
ncbi:hypothetical protein GE061_011312 [Apolygus lucorum]|uniref:Uncharacterized protein n=1 Tax=Apolygus lucorum TaxID=248454 RepID=A0A6A4K0M8_APOLU|nr:hypothetical protein GE061_011312 [Apolygus lucorum]